jgi:hypothetical protein
MNKNIVLGLGIVLIAVGVFKPDLSNLLPKGGSTVTVPAVLVSEPTDPELLASALKVAEALKGGDKADALALSGLYSDIAKLVGLEGKEEVVKTTSELVEVNSVAGSLMNLNLKGKYPNLAPAAKELISKAFGGDEGLDVSVLNADSRKVAVASFEALAWGCAEGGK